MIVTVGNTKGGVGKTTLALQLALARARAGRDILLVDGDRQGSAQTAVAIRAGAGRTPGLSCVQYHEGAVLRAQVLRQAVKYDDVVIDAGGRDSTALRAALSLTERLIVPFLPRSVDVRWLAKFGQVDKWKFCLRAARMPLIRSDNDKTSTPDTCPGLQGEGGLGCHQRREDAGRVSAAV
jgi:cellulose biosynthesis protein BcsQ